MTHDELALKLTPGNPHESEYPGNSYYPCGHADGVIFRASKKKYVTLNGQTVIKGSKPKKGSDDFEAPADIEGERILHRAICYIQPASEEDRTTPFGFTHQHGLVNHLGGLIDKLATHNDCLKKERDAGYTLLHFAAMTEIGKKMMHPEIFAFLKVVPVEEGIFAIVYDPDGDIA